MVHTYSLNGYNITIDGNSGSIHVLDDITYEMLKGENEMPAFADEIFFLRDADGISKIL